MEIKLPTDFLSLTKDKYILLDTNVFIDALLHPADFQKLFNQLESNNVTLATLEVVLLEFLKGAPTEEKYKEKQKFVDQIVKGVYLPVRDVLFEKTKKLLLLYKEEGKGLSITDLLLGATLMQYREKVLLLTKNTTEFPNNIFDLVTYFNLFYRKGIHSYGIYSFK